MGWVIALLAIAAVELVAAIWLYRVAADLRGSIRRIRSAIREVHQALDAAGTEPEPEGRHAALVSHGRHAASPPNDLESYAGSGFDLNGWHPGTGS